MILAKRNLLNVRIRNGSLLGLSYLFRRTLKPAPRVLAVQNFTLAENHRSHSTTKNNVVDKARKKFKRTKRDTTDITSRENILLLEIDDLLNGLNGIATSDSIKNSNILIETFLYSWKRPLTVLGSIDIIFQTSEGEGLALVSKSTYATEFFASQIKDRYTIVKVPKTIVGDRVSVRLLRHHEFYAEAELISVLNTGSKDNNRKDELVICDKFSDCSGCQFQMLHYDDQLQFKKSVIQRAFRFFYPKLVSEYNGFGDSINIVESPKQYAYRTKLTPHYEFSGSKVYDENSIDIGFNHINPTKQIVDVDYCPIASPVVNRTLPHIRAETRLQLKDELENSGKKDNVKNSRGATLLLRDSIWIDHQTGEYERVCLTKHKNIITEKIDDYVFQFPASEFFQNNNSILPHVLDYIRYQINKNHTSYKYIVDTYCGSGFFGIALSRDIPEDGRVFGIEVSKLSIKHAIHNAKLNGLPIPEKIQFVEGNANSIFTNEEFVQSGIVGQDTIVIMDPSRKGSNKKFMEQLLEFKPKLIVYVSCNVFTQARDLADFDNLQTKHNCSYKIREIIGFDFFPQTKHVESVAILELEE